MAITTTVARHYSIRMLLIGALCVLFGLWGAYDLFVKIPREEQAFARFTELNERADALEKVTQDGGRLTATEQGEYDAIEQELAELFGGAPPTEPSKFDRAVQVLAMSCLLAAPYFFWVVISARRRTHRLEDDGTLVTPAGRWEREAIADIDMSRWMSKSVATVVHRDGSRIKLDDYVHKDVHLIVGSIGSRLYPDQWDERGRRVVAKQSPADDGIEGTEADA